MAKNGFRVLDSDIHIIEPPDLWARYIDAPFKHQAPRGFADWVLDLRIEIDGKLMPANVSCSAGSAKRSTCGLDSRKAWAHTCRKSGTASGGTSCSATPSAIRASRCSRP